MSLLVPFFLAGLTALALPLFLHLVRRTPQGRQSFSSLMFLEPTPPQLTRRSRLDQLLLLLMRLGAIGLATLAFARPFLRETASLSVSDLPGRRVALLIDHSASLQRSGMWSKLIQLVEEELTSLGPQDQVALYLFDDRLETVLGFDAGTGGESQIALIRNRLKELKPGWRETNLGGALSALASELESSSDANQSALDPQIVLLTDMSRGSRLEALEQFEWPDRVRVVLRTVDPATPTNATLRVLQDVESTGLDKVRIRVSNCSNSTREEFEIRWFDVEERPIPATNLTVYVPPGQTRVVQLAIPPAADRAAGVVLTGDDHEFDNRCYTIPVTRREVSVGFVGESQSGDTGGPRYYLELALSNDPTRDFRIELFSDDFFRSTETTPLPLIVVTDAITPEQGIELRRRADTGCIVLAAPATPEAAASLPQLLPELESVTASSPGQGGYLLLGDIDFSHPLFAPFSNPPYSDFTRIHFWQSWHLNWKAAAPDSRKTQILARFDNSEPAWVEEQIGRGRVLAITSGWTPSQSQLALSSKFVGLLGTLLDLALGDHSSAPQLTTGQPAPLPPSAMKLGCRVVAPGGTSTDLPAGSTQFLGTEVPGLYTVNWDSESVPLAVNIGDLESQTAPLDIEQLERRGVPLGRIPPQTERLEQLRQLRDQELESRQKLWRWLLAGALGMVILETWWAGRSEQSLLTTEALR